jgi:hypothetical protein
METHKNLQVWKRSINFVTAIYKLTNAFPKEELYGIVSQIRRAAVSSPLSLVPRPFSPPLPFILLTSSPDERPL